MAWRPMRSLAESPSSQTTGLRGQVNAIAPNRSTASDGLVGDENHETTSGHYPHYVAGVGDEIVTAWDCTNDPKNGCDSRLLAETLRQHRDPRIRYVISSQEIFSSYASGSRPAWTWGPYSGADPHTNHAHIQVLDAQISDTTTPWNLEGFGDTVSVADVRTGIAQMADEGAQRNTPTGRSYADDFNVMVSAALADEFTKVYEALAALDVKLDLILAKLDQGGGGTVVLPATSNFTATQTATGVITWVPTE